MNGCLLVFCVKIFLKGGEGEGEEGRMKKKIKKRFFLFV